MPKIKLIVSLFIFSILLGTTSTIKNQTRIIEKNIYKIDRRILAIEKDLHETELDYSYLSSPKILFDKFVLWPFVPRMKTSESINACQLASMIFSETPIVVQFASPFVLSRRTRVTAPVPFSVSRTRTL